MKRMFFLTTLFLSGHQACSMQSKMRVREFDQVVFREKLNHLPHDIQRRCIVPYLWRVAPKAQNQDESESDLQTLIIDYSLVPALMSFDCTMLLRIAIKSHNEAKSLKLPSHLIYEPSYFHKYVQIIKGRPLGQKDNIDSELFRVENVNLFEQAQFMRDNPKFFMAFSDEDGVTIHVHASWAKKLERYKLTTVQLDFIADLFKAQVLLEEKMDRDMDKGFFNPTEITLSEAEETIFYSLPCEIQKNLQANYHFTKSFSKACHDAVKKRAPQVARGLNCLARVHAQYECQPLMTMAKTAIKTAAFCYGLKWAAGSRLLRNRNGLLLKLLNHKYKLRFSVAGLCAAQDIYGAVVSDYLAERSPTFKEARRCARRAMRVRLA